MVPSQIQEIVAIQNNQISEDKQIIPESILQQGKDSLYSEREREELPDI
nr:MAG TPA: hypothetical protein [Caudoviricetes sp.]